MTIRAADIAPSACPLPTYPPGELTVVDRIPWGTPRERPASYSAVSPPGGHRLAITAAMHVDGGMMPLARAVDGAGRSLAGIGVGTVAENLELFSGDELGEGRMIDRPVGDLTGLAGVEVQELATGQGNFDRAGGGIADRFQRAPPFLRLCCAERAWRYLTAVSMHRGIFEAIPKASAVARAPGMARRDAAQPKVKRNMKLKGSKRKKKAPPSTET